MSHSHPAFASTSDPLDELQGPLADLEREHRAIGIAADELLRLFEIPHWGQEEATAIDELLRSLRVTLPAHCVKEEQILFPELVREGILDSDTSADLRRRHLLVEADFVEVQAVAFALLLGERTRVLRRKLLRQARRFLTDLDELVAHEESAAIRPGAHCLSLEAAQRVRSQLEAAALRAVLKRMQAGAPG